MIFEVTKNLEKKIVKVPTSKQHLHEIDRNSKQADDGNCSSDRKPESRNNSMKRGLWMDCMRPVGRTLCNSTVLGRLHYRSSCVAMRVETDLENIVN